MRQFIDATGQLWASGALVGKIGSVFTSANTQHGGLGGTILSADQKSSGALIATSRAYTDANMNVLKAGLENHSTRSVNPLAAR
jgi:multimeric flavodoxin WrbA